MNINKLKGATFVICAIFLALSLATNFYKRPVNKHTVEECDIMIKCLNEQIDRSKDLLLSDKFYELSDKKAKWEIEKLRLSNKRF